MTRGQSFSREAAVEMKPTTKRPQSQAKYQSGKKPILKEGKLSLADFLSGDE